MIEEAAGLLASVVRGIALVVELLAIAMGDLTVCSPDFRRCRGFGEATVPVEHGHSRLATAQQPVIRRMLLGALTLYRFPCP